MADGRPTDRDVLLVLEYWVERAHKKLVDRMKRAAEEVDHEQ